MHIEVPPVSSPELLDSVEGEGSAAVAARVEAARRLQLARFEGRDELYANGQMGARDVRKFCDADETGLSLLRSAMARFGLSARSFHRVLKTARTIADLKAADVITRGAHRRGNPVPGTGSERLGGVGLVVGIEPGSHHRAMVEQRTPDQ